MDTIKILFGYFDLAVVIILIFLNFRFWNKLSIFNSCLPAAISFGVFGFILPLISMIIEIQLNSGPGDESINLLYTYFRFPVYWVIGLIQFFIISSKVNR